MRRTLLAFLLCSGCLAGSGTLQRDDRLLRELARQERWAQQALDARPAKDQLESIRSSDFGSVAAARKELQKLIQAADRGTWIRETALELSRDDNDPRIAQGFERAGRLRSEAVQAADELASALAEAHGGLSAADLKPALEMLRKAQASEERLGKRPATASGLRFSQAPLPPAPFQDAAARVGSEAPKTAGKAPAHEETQAHAKAADQEREKEDQRQATAPPDAGNAPGEEVEAQAPSTTLKIAGDAARLFAKKPPSSITLREDGLFALSYDDGDHLVDPAGNEVRKEPRSGEPKAAPAEQKAPPAGKKPAGKTPAPPPRP